MTAVILLDELKKFIEEAVKDFSLPVRPVKVEKPTTPVKRTAALNEKPAAPLRRAPEVYKMRLPNKEAETNRIPYIVLQFLTGKDDQQPGEGNDSECKVRIIAATYSEDGSEGAVDVLNVITRIRIALLKAREVGQQFLLRLPLEYIVYPDDTADTSPYYFAEMVVIWEMPEIRREIDNYYHDNV